MANLECGDTLSDGEAQVGVDSEGGFTEQILPAYRLSVNPFVACGKLSARAQHFTRNASCQAVAIAHIQSIVQRNIGTQCGRRSQGSRPGINRRGLQVIRKLFGIDYARAPGVRLSDIMRVGLSQKT